MTTVTTTLNSITVTDDGTSVDVNIASAIAAPHAASHGSAGYDPVTIAQSQVTNLTSDLAGKAATVTLWLPGSTANTVSCPDAAPLDITGDIDIRIKVALDDWTANNALIAKDNGVDGQRSWFVWVTASGIIRYQWYTGGATASTVNADSTVATGVADGSPKWVRVTHDVDNGAGGNDTKFYLSDDGTTWTQLGSTVTKSGTVTLFSGPSNIVVGTAAGVTMTGKFYRAQLRSGIDGTIVADVDVTNGVGPRIRDNYTNLWTINGTANGWMVQ